MISPTAESLITFCLLDSSTNCHKTSTASSAALKHKQNITSSLKLLFTCGLLCASNSSVILAILYLFFFLLLLRWIGGKWKLPLLSCWAVAFLPLEYYLLTHILCFLMLILAQIHCFQHFWVEKLPRNGLCRDDITIWVKHICTPLRFRVFSAHVFDKRPLITITHCHLRHTAALNRPDQSTLPKNRR